MHISISRLVCSSISVAPNAIPSTGMHSIRHQLRPLNPAQVRLLTGIGRFHEMSYIIGLLLEYDEFESLVHTGVEKVCLLATWEYVLVYF